MFSERNCILIDYIQRNQLTEGQGALGIMRRKEVYRMESKPKKKRKTKEKGGNCSLQFQDQKVCFLTLYYF